MQNIPSSFFRQVKDFQGYGTYQNKHYQVVIKGKVELAFSRRLSRKQPNQNGKWPTSRSATAIARTVCRRYAREWASVSKELGMAGLALGLMLRLLFLLHLLLLLHVALLQLLCLLLVLLLYLPFSCFIGILLGQALVVLLLFLL